jgi:signal transduction histidine kinase
MARVAPVLTKQGEALRSGDHGQASRALVEEAGEGVRQLVQATEDVVAAELHDGERLARTSGLVLVVLFAMTLLVLAAGTYVFHRHILLPLGRLFELINDLRLGKLEARWTERRTDEIGRTGRTVSLMAEQLDRMRRERRQFVDSVSHDLKNPVFAVSLHCQRALRKGDALSLAEAQRAFEAIGALCGQISRITDDLHEIVQDAQPIWSLALASDSLVTMARRWVEEIRVAYPDHPIRLEEVEGSSEAAIDAGRVRQVLANLVANAAKYSAPGAPIDVVVGSNGPEEVFLEVRDRGIGVPDPLKARIFEPYARGDEGRAMANGLGLGLSIVRRIVALHGGRIRVADRNDGGSIFRVVLPRRRPKPKAAPNDSLGAAV